jgi:DNA-binding XRE family transcriptional regulator
MTQDINRLKVVLAEKKHTNKWLSEQEEKNPAMESKRETNTTQPSLETLIAIANMLDVTVQDFV